MVKTYGFLWIFPSTNDKSSCLILLNPYVFRMFVTWIPMNACYQDLHRLHSFAQPVPAWPPACLAPERRPSGLWRQCPPRQRKQHLIGGIATRKEWDPLVNCRKIDVDLEKLRVFSGNSSSNPYLALANVNFTGGYRQIESMSKTAMNHVSICLRGTMHDPLDWKGVHTMIYPLWNLGYQKWSCPRLLG